MAFDLADIDLGDKGTQLMLGGAAIGAGLLIAALRGRSAGTSGAESADAGKPISIAVPGGWGTRGDAPDTPGAWGWVGAFPDKDIQKPADKPPVTTPGTWKPSGGSMIQKLAGNLGWAVKEGTKLNFYDTNGKSIGSQLMGEWENPVTGSIWLLGVPGRAWRDKKGTHGVPGKTDPPKTDPPKTDPPKNTPDPLETKSPVLSQAGLPYGCPPEAFLTWERGGTGNHVCERKDDGRQFQTVPKGRGGDGGTMRAIPGLTASGGFSATSTPIVLRDVVSVDAGESLRDIAIKVYGTQRGLGKLASLNQDVIASGQLREGTLLRVR